MLIRLGNTYRKIAGDVRLCPGPSPNPARFREASELVLRRFSPSKSFSRSGRRSIRVSRRYHHSPATICWSRLTISITTCRCKQLSFLFLLQIRRLYVPFSRVYAHLAYVQSRGAFLVSCSPCLVNLTSHLVECHAIY